MQSVDCALNVMQDQLSKVEELQSIQTFATKLLQISRSTPYLVAALIGHKRVCCFTDALTLMMTICDALLATFSLCTHASSGLILTNAIVTQATHVLQNLDLTSQNPLSNDTFYRVASLARQAAA